VVHSGGDASAPIFGAGELYFRLVDGSALLAFIKVDGAPSWAEEVGAPVAFSSFLCGALREEYCKPVNLFYDTSYQNLVLTGTARSASGTDSSFFFVAGVHDKGFPWGDGELFWDVLFVIATAVLDSCIASAIGSLRDSKSTSRVVAAATRDRSSG
jgi:hypothetical protein